MILDKQNAWHDDTVVTTATTYAGDIIDHGPGGSVAADFTVLCVVTEVFDAGGTSVQVVLEQDNDEAMGSATEIFDSGAITDPALGYEFFRFRQLHINERYTRCRVVSLGTYSTGQIFAGVIGAPQVGEPTA